MEGDVKILSLTIRNDKKAIYRGKWEGVVDIIAAIADESRDDKFYLIVRRAVLLRKEETLPDINFIDDMKNACGIL